MHLTGTVNLGTSCKTGLSVAFLLVYDFMFDRIILRIKVRGHLVMSIIQFMNLISVQKAILQLCA